MNSQNVPVSLRAVSFRRQNKAQNGSLFHHPGEREEKKPFPLSLIPSPPLPYSESLNQIADSFQFAAGSPEDRAWIHLMEYLRRSQILPLVRICSLDMSFFFSSYSLSLSLSLSLALSISNCLVFFYVFLKFPCFFSFK